MSKPVIGPDICPDCSDADHVFRFVESLVLGEVADVLFELECHRRGLRPVDCLASPLVYLCAPVGGGSDARH